MPKGTNFRKKKTTFTASRRRRARARLRLVARDRRSGCSLHRSSDRAEVRSGSRPLFLMERSSQPRAHSTRYYTDARTSHADTDGHGGVRPGIGTVRPISGGGRFRAGGARPAAADLSGAARRACARAPPPHSPFARHPAVAAPLPASAHAHVPAPSPAPVPALRSSESRRRVSSRCSGRRPAP